MLDAVSNLHHITWVVADLEAALTSVQPLCGASPVIRESLPGRGVATARIRCGATWLVFVQPLGPGQPAERLAAHGEGPMLLSLRVESLDAALQALAQRGVRAAGTPRRGLADWQVVDLELTLPGGVTLQLCEELQATAREPPR